MVQAQSRALSLHKRGEQMNNIAEKLALRYGGIVAQPQECEMYLSSEQRFLFGINLDDPKANYKLLTAGDLQSLSDATRAACVQAQSSPFDGLKLIVYKGMDGTVNFKLLHGMASQLVREMAYLCNHPDFFTDSE